MLLRKFWVSENFDATRNILEAFVKVLLLCVSFLSKYCSGAFFSAWVCELHQGFHGQGKLLENFLKRERKFLILSESVKSQGILFSRL